MKLPPNESQKSDHAECKHCGKRFACSSQALQRHANACEGFPKGVGLLPAGKVLDAYIDPDNDDDDHVVVVPAKRPATAPLSRISNSQSSSGFPQWCDSMSADDRERANALLAKAMHRSATPFTFFSSPEWVEWMHFIRPSYSFPSPDVIGGTLLNDEYVRVQQDTIREIAKFRVMCMTLDGATNKAGKQVLNHMVCGPQAFFWSHFSMNLTRETAANLFTKLLNCKARLREAIGLPLRPTNRETEIKEDDVELAQVQRDEPMWCLSTDSPSVMTCLRQLAIRSKEFTFAFGCAAHGGHNLCMDWLKNPIIKTIVSENVFIVNKINEMHLLNSMFDRVVLEKFGRPYALILFTKSRWCTSAQMLKRNLLVKSALIAMPHMIDHDDKYSDVSMEADLHEAILDTNHWKGTAGLEELLKPLCCAITHLEGDDATFSAVYACFVHIDYHINIISEDVLLHLKVDRDELLGRVLYPLGTIYSPAHALAFVTDPWYHDMRASMTRLHRL